MHTALTIDDFSGDNFYLSNFAPCPNGVMFEGELYTTSEHAYQAKTLDKEMRKKIQATHRPGLAKRIGQNVPMRSDWDKIKIPIMHQIVRSKFERNPEYKEKLINSTEYLVEGNTWNDKFWGVCDGKGENHLGKVLMRLREELILNKWTVSK